VSHVFIITGTRKGIGRNLAEHYLSKGHVVAGCSRSDCDLVHCNYRHFPLDVAHESAVIAMVREVKKEFGRIDVLLNNAGIAAMNHLLTTPYTAVRSVFESNFFGSFLFLREVSKIMCRQHSGRIVNFTTVASPLRLEGEAVYAASKSAIESLTQIAAYELGGMGVTVNAIGPTPIPTDLIRNVPADKLHELIQRQAIKRAGNFNDVLNVIDFFIAESSDFVTGQVIYLGGVVR
jgi:3-oxoacyl-[acyl-carrier protein] reductase